MVNYCQMEEPHDPAPLQQSESYYMDIWRLLCPPSQSVQDLEFSSMGVGEEERKKVELIHVALQQLMDEKRNKHKGKNRAEEDDDEDKDSLLISQLLSQLESFEKDASSTIVPTDLSKTEEPSSSTCKHKECEAKEIGIEEIVRELRRVKRQNLITHCLLSAMIIITAFWQFSEVSLLLMVREKLSNPFRAIGDVIKGRLMGGEKKPTNGSVPLPPGMPELPHVDLPALTFNGGNE